jgi:hypothetical protein
MFVFLKKTVMFLSASAFGSRALMVNNVPKKWFEKRMKEKDYNAHPCLPLFNRGGATPRVGGCRAVATRHCGEAANRACGAGQAASRRGEPPPN